LNPSLPVATTPTDHCSIEQGAQMDAVRLKILGNRSGCTCVLESNRKKAKQFVHSDQVAHAPGKSIHLLCPRPGILLQCCRSSTRFPRQCVRRACRPLPPSREGLPAPVRRKFRSAPGDPWHPGPSPPHHHPGRRCFFLAWLGIFKIALPAVGLYPLDSALPVLPCIVAAAVGMESEPQFGHAVEQ